VPALRLTWPQVLAWRAERQRLLPRARRDERLDVVAQVGGLHAQVMASAELEWCARLEGGRREDLARALWDDRTLVKTWAMRGTLHLLPAAELGLWCAALAPLDERQRAPGVLNRIGVTREQADAVIAAIPEALEGAALTREELADAVGRITGQEELGERILGQYGDQLLKAPAFRGELCFAPSAGTKVRFTHPRTWLSEAPQVGDPAAAGAELARRYLGAYGPSSPAELGRWTGTTTAQGKAWLAGLEPGELAEVDVEGRTLVCLAEHAAALREAEPLDPACVRLLPAYDVHTIGTARDDEATVPAGRRGTVWASAGRVLPVILAGGRMAGTWRHERGRRVRVELAPWEKLPAGARAAAEAEAERVAGVLGAELDLAWAA
jgi:hypothetical protein